MKRLSMARLLTNAARRSNNQSPLQRLKPVPESLGTAGLKPGPPFAERLAASGLKSGPPKAQDCAREALNLRNSGRGIWKVVAVVFLAALSNPAQGEDGSPRKLAEARR